jgi:hypothetical protein
MAWTPKCPEHKIEMQLTTRKLPKEQIYHLCPRWGCVHRYREGEGFFTTGKLPIRSAPAT